jgi:hypothetical protein
LFAAKFIKISITKSKVSVLLKESCDDFVVSPHSDQFQKIGLSARFT